MDSSKTYVHSTSKNEYTVSVSSTPQELTLRMSEKYSMFQWAGTYSKEYLEQEITKKTGHPLQFEVFVRLIVQSLEKTDESCFIDILTSQDLENLKAKKAESKPSLSKSNKRYMILTHMTNDIRTHYPLPLTVSREEDNPEKLKELYKALREEVDTHRFRNLNDSKSLSITYEKKSKGGGSVQTKEIDELKSEHEILKSKLKRLQEPKRNANSQFLTMESRIKELQATLENPNMKMVDLRCAVEEQNSSSVLLKAELIQLHHQISKLLISEKETKIRKHGEEVDKQLTVARAGVTKNAVEIDRLKQEVEKGKAKNKELDVKNKKLTTELNVIKRGGRRGPYSTGSLSVSSKASSYAGSISSKRSGYSYNSNKYR